MMRLEPLLQLGALVAGFLLGMALFSPPAPAHSWYPLECCNDRDCFEITPGVDIIGQRRDGQPGYFIPASGEWFAIERLRETPPEGRDHWARCTLGGSPKRMTMGRHGPKACIYRPPARF